ncbi:TPA: hypothetical protein N0F65_012624, partial [Lagenidium giganteum]
MNPEEEQLAPSREKQSSTANASTHKKVVFQRRLKDKISESRMLQLLDRQLGVNDANDNNQSLDEELVCDSTMIAVSEQSATDTEMRSAGALKTVRCIHRLRAHEQQQQLRYQSHPEASGNQGDQGEA